MGGGSRRHRSASAYIGRGVGNDPTLEIPVNNEPVAQEERRPSLSRRMLSGGGAGTKGSRRKGDPRKIKHLADLKLEAEIGKGSFGKVMKAKHLRTGTIYALKILNVEEMKKGDMLDQIEEERQIMSAIDTHPSIVTLYTSWQARGSLYFLLEFVPGSDLFEEVRRCRHIAPRRAARYVLQIAMALDYLQSKRVVYRDLKLENLLLNTTADTVQLADFGLAKQLTDERPKTNTICGTIQYMAPELLANQFYGHAVDWWSLGVVAFCMVYGRYPYSRGVDKLAFDRSAKDREIMYKRIKQDLASFPDLAGVESVVAIRKLLEPEPRIRASSRDQLMPLRWFAQALELPGPKLTSPPSPRSTGSVSSESVFFISGDASGAGSALANFDGVFVAPVTQAASGTDNSGSTSNSRTTEADEDDDLFGILRRYHRRRGSTARLLPHSNWDVTPARMLRVVQGLGPRELIRAEGARAASALTADYAGERLPAALAREADVLRSSREAAANRTPSTPSTPLASVNISLPPSGQTVSGTDGKNVPSGAALPLSEGASLGLAPFGKLPASAETGDTRVSCDKAEELLTTESTPEVSTEDSTPPTPPPGDLDILFDTILLSQTLRYDDQRSPAKEGHEAVTPSAPVLAGDASKRKRARKGRSWFWRGGASSAKSQPPTASLNCGESPQRSSPLTREGMTAVEADTSAEVQPPAPIILLTEASGSSSLANSAARPVALDGDSDDGSEDDAWLAEDDASAEAAVDDTSAGLGDGRDVAQLSEEEVAFEDVEGTPSRVYQEAGEEYLETLV